MHKAIFAVLAVFSAVAPDARAAEQLTAAVFGAANFNAMSNAYLRPFSKATDIPVRDGIYDGAMDALMRSVKAGKPTWDVMQVETRTLDIGCREGLFERLDFSRIGNKPDF